LIDSVGQLNASFVGVTFANSTARTATEMGLSTISLDLTNRGLSDGFYVSFWFRFARTAVLAETRLLTSQSINLSVAFDALGNVNLRSVFVQNTSVSSIASAQTSGASWDRITVGFTGTSTYMRAFRFDLGNVVDQLPSVTPTSRLRRSTSLVLGGTFNPQQLEFKDLVLFLPRNSTDVMSPAFDETVARQYNPNPSVPTLPPPPTILTTMATRMPTTAASLSSGPAGTIVPASEEPLSTGVVSFTVVGSTESTPTDASTSSASIATSAVESLSAPSPSSFRAASPSTVSSSAAYWSLIGGIVGGCVALALIVVVALVVWYRRRNRGSAPAGPPPSEYGMIAYVRSSSEYDDVASVRSKQQAECNAIADVRNDHDYDAPSSKLV
jgi:hypothetical protein